MSHILPELITTEDTANYRFSIENLIDDMYGSPKNNISSELESNFEHKYFTFLNGLISSKKMDVKKINKRDLEVLLKEQLDELQKLSQIEVILAIRPSEKLLQKIYTWFKLNGYENFVLDVKHDISVVGGLAISIEGNYHDYTLKTKLDNYDFSKFGF